MRSVETVTVVSYRSTSPFRETQLARAKSAAQTEMAQSKRRRQDGEQVVPVRAVAKSRDLATAMLCMLPPLYLSTKLPTLHTVTDNKWLVVVFLSALAVFLIALGAAVRPAASDRSRSPLRMALLIGAAALVATHLLSALLSREPGFSLGVTLPSLVLMVLFGAIIWQAPRRDDIRKFVALAIATGALVGACALAQHGGFDPLGALVRYHEVGRYRTGVYVTLGNPEYLAGYLAPLAVAALGLVAASRDCRGKCAALAAAILTAVPVFLSGSRGAFLGMVAGAVVLLTGALVCARQFSRRARIGGLVAVGALVAAVIAAVWSAPRETAAGLLRTRLGDLANPYSSSIRNRIVFNLMGLEMIATRPVVGVGPGMFGAEFPRAFLEHTQREGGVALEMFARDFSGRIAEHAHNDWVEIWAETGTLGFAAWLWVVVVWAIAVARAVGRRTAEPPSDRLLTLALTAATVVILVNALFNFPLHEPVRATLFWLLLAWSGSAALSGNYDPSRSQV
ncbi:hypothetical protein AMJ85_02515 [candidate division BRC1 bacterium SM23_51]|nr:MAG: hypothetical protein AMJ85_02515 [candidate division BRC1 bacterium SM23_51]